MSEVADRQCEDEVVFVVLLIPDQSVFFLDPVVVLEVELEELVDFIGVKVTVVVEVLDAFGPSISPEALVLWFIFGHQVSSGVDDGVIQLVDEPADVVFVLLHRISGLRCEDWHLWFVGVEAAEDVGPSGLGEVCFLCCCSHRGGGPTTSKQKNTLDMELVKNLCRNWTNPTVDSLVVICFLFSEGCTTV